MIPSQVRIFAYTERQDMRRSFDGLALAVRERLALDPESGALFVFASKRGDALKVLCFDGISPLRPSSSPVKRPPASARGNSAEDPIDD